jgi:hypothetical protein
MNGIVFTRPELEAIARLIAHAMHGPEYGSRALGTATHKLAAELGYIIHANKPEPPEEWLVRVHERTVERATMTHEAILGAGGMVGVLAGTHDGAGGVEGELVGKLYATEAQVISAMRTLAEKGIAARFARAPIA